MCIYMCTNQPVLYVQVLVFNYSFNFLQSVRHAGALIKYDGQMFYLIVDWFFLQAARPSADPLILKRKQEEAGKTYEKKAKYTDDHLTPSERLKNSVTPLWKLEYKEQLRVSC